MAAGALSIKDAWNAVAVEERLELLARAKAEGIMAAFCCVLLMGSIAYGFDKIWVLAGGAVASLLVIPLFSSYSWRRNKPALILSYLAVRSVARRYAYGHRMADLDVILIFRGQMEQLFNSEEERQLAKQQETVDFDTHIERQKDVWICLMRGAVAVLSERLGGAKLEFIAPVLPELTTRKPKQGDELPERCVIINGLGPSKGRSVAISSSYPGALYVFEKQLARLIQESVTKKQLADNVRVAEISLT